MYNTVYTECMRGAPVVPHSHPDLVCYFNLNLLECVDWNFIVILISFAFMANDVEHVFICGIAILRAFSVKYSF